MKLLYLDPSGLGLLGDHFLGLLNQGKGPKTHVDVRHVDTDKACEALLLPSRPEEYYSGLLRMVREAEEAGYEAVMIGCASEPGLRAAANASRIPVFGPFGAALHVAGLLGRRLGVLCPAHLGKRERPLTWYEQAVRLYGIAESMVSFRLVEVSKPEESFIQGCVNACEWDRLRVETLARYRASILENGVDQAIRAVQEDRAEVVFFACTMWGGMLAPVTKALDVPVLDPVFTMLRATEMAVTAAQLSTCLSPRQEYP